MSTRHAVHLQIIQIVGVVNNKNINLKYVVVPFLIMSVFSRYAAGTNPWGSITATNISQRHDDGYLEVIGLTPSSLVRLVTFP